MKVVYGRMKFYRLVDVDSEALPFKKVNNKKLNYKVRAYQLYSSSHNHGPYQTSCLYKGAIFHFHDYWRKGTSGHSDLTRL